jgi:sulfur-oxidizing protein SoxZ
MIARLSLSPVARANERCDVRLAIPHQMETGVRRGDNGAVVPRNVIETITITFDGEPVLKGKLGSGISANPFFAFSFMPPREGMLVIEWVDTQGMPGRASAALTFRSA